jgi:hypothetical protein
MGLYRPLCDTLVQVCHTAQAKTLQQVLLARVL